MINIWKNKKNADKLEEFKKEFLKFFDGKNPKSALQFNKYCNLILQVFLKLESFMTSDHVGKFRKILEEFLDAVIKKNQNQQKETNRI